MPLNSARGITPIEIGCVVASPELIVLIMRDGGLRSALIARLSLQGESLLTLDTDPDGLLINRVAPSPRILVIDKAALGDRLQALVDGALWQGIIVIDDEAEQAVTGDRLRVVRRARALTGVVETLASWRKLAYS